MDSNTFWMISGTFKMFTKSGLLGPVLITKMRQRILEQKYGNISKKYDASIYHHLVTPKFPICLTRPDIKHVELIFSFLNLVDPQHLASPSVFKELFGGGISISFGNMKNHEISLNITKSY